MMTWTAFIRYRWRYFGRLMLALVAYGFAAAARAEEQAPLPDLLFPLDCTLGETCWTARYTDRQADNGFADFTCGTRTQHDHNGTDFSIGTLSDMQKGVAVLAAADGTVWKLRDGVPDEFVTKETQAEKSRIGNGNTIVLAHRGGMTTQYSHMKKGSLTVKVGDTVKAGDKIGEVGLSGLTEYPHLHFAVWASGNLTDPFDGQPVKQACTENTAAHVPLWQTPVAYEDMALVKATLTPYIPKGTDRWSGQPDTMPADAPMMILSGQAFGAETGDKWWLRIIAPGGRTFFEHTEELKKGHQIQYQYGGKKQPDGGFHKGIWTGEITIIRQYPDGTLLRQKQTTSITVQ